MANPSIRIAALYKFGRIPNALALQPQLKSIAVAHEVCGTLIVAEEGINGTIAGLDHGLERVLDAIRAIPGFEELEIKESWTDEMPFSPMKVHCKPEIVTMGIDGVDPRERVGEYVQPQDWNGLIAEPGVVVIDTRNHYEVRIGTFEGAESPETASFREFPEWVKANEERLKDASKIAMFCTGGIRCERATAHLLNEGYEDVFHLKGGILKYLETVPETDSRWNGECFVFDQRVSVVHGLSQGQYDICYACREPIDDGHKASEQFVPGVSCPLCFDRTTDEQKRNYAERQKQMRLTREREAAGQAE